MNLSFRLGSHLWVWLPLQDSPCFCNRLHRKTQAMFAGAINLNGKSYALHSWFPCGIPFQKWSRDLFLAFQEAQQPIQRNGLPCKMWHLSANQGIKETCHFFSWIHYGMQIPPSLFFFPGLTLTCWRNCGLLGVEKVILGWPYGFVLLLSNLLKTATQPNPPEHASHVP